MPRPAFLALALTLGFVPSLPAQPVTRAEVKPGLIFTASSAGRSYTRLEPIPALCLAPGEAAHPRVPDADTFTWSGFLNVVIPGKYQFDAVVAGKLEVRVGGAAVLAAEVAGADPAAAKEVSGAAADLRPGFQPIAVTLSRAGPAARLELLWKGPGFQREPVPYFFFSHKPTDRPAALTANLARDHGRLLFEELACGRCHKPDPGTPLLADRAGPSLTAIGARAYPGWIAAWLADPHQLRPHTAMPKPFADDANGTAERYAVAAFLASLGGPAIEDRRDRLGQMFDERAENGAKLYLTAGCAACHGDRVDADPTAKKKADDGDEEDDAPAARPDDSFQAFGTAGPRGDYRLGAVGSKFPTADLGRFLRNPLARNPHGRMPNLLLTDREAQDIARFLVRHTDGTIKRALPPPPDGRPETEWLRWGKSLVVSKGCANCHEIEADGQPLVGRDYPSLSAVAKAGAAGCLAERPDPARVPAYPLSAGQRAALAAFLAGIAEESAAPSPAFAARLALKRFACLNCHNRDGEGGIPEALADLMKALEKAENADDVRPPRLTSVGHKLLTPWFEQVLTGAGRARPWMGLRMPHYGGANVGFLAVAVPKLEGCLPDAQPTRGELTAEKLDAGRTLVGKTASGFGCIACHDIAGVRGGGTRGPDLAEIGGRLRFDWYARWMHQPQRLAPGTRMPQNFLNGRSLLAGVLKGDADAQIEAIWAYLSLGPSLPLPDGIEPPNQGMVIPVKDKAEVLRTFLPEIPGGRGIAVGYPGGLNLAFDADGCRLAYAWGGNFLDAGPVWTERGGQPAKPQGAKFWAAPAGHPWAVTEGVEPTDFTAREADPKFGRPLEHDALFSGPRFVRFAGYTLDHKGFPTFRYTLGEPDGQTALTVHEKPAPLPVTVAAGFERAFTVEVGPNRTAWFRAATAPAGAARTHGSDGPQPLTGEVPAAGRRVVIPQPGGGAVVLELASGPDGIVWRTNGADVLLRLPASALPRRVELRLRTWGLARDDERLVSGLKP